MKNYDAILISWNARSTNSPLILGAAGLKYCAADAARVNLIKAIANGGHGWTINSDAKECPKHTVVFDTQGGMAIAGQEVAFTDKITAPVVSNRQGYTFAGWYTDNTFARAWNFAVDTMPDSNLTLYAKWIENPKSVATSSGASESNSSSSTKLAETGADAGIFFSAAVTFIAVGSIAIKLIKRS